MELNEYLQAEEAKRRRNWDARERWKTLQHTIEWADRQATVPRNTPQACLREQRRKLAQFGLSVLRG